MNDNNTYQPQSPQPPMQQGDMQQPPTQPNNQFDSPAGQFPQQHMQGQTVASGATEQVQNNNQQPPEKKAKGSLKIFAVVLLAFVFLLSIAGGAFAYAVAYEKIDIGNEDLQRNISHAVMSLPFAPKTPRYVLENSLLAHATTTSHSFDASASIASDSFVSDFGLSSIDVKFTGDVDYNDLSNINFDATVDVTNKFQALVKKIDTMVYAKIEKLPTELLVFMGINSENLNPVIENWVKYDITPLDSEARNLIEEDVEGESYTNEIATRVIEALIDREILDSIQMTTEEYEGEDVYVLQYNPTAEEIDYLFERLEEAIDDPDTIDVQRQTEEIKLSEIITKLEIKIRISTQDQLLRWASVQSTIESPDDTGDLSVMITPYIQDDQKIDLAFVLKLNNYNQPVDVEQPSNALTFEEYAQKFIEAVYPEEGGFGILPAVNPGRQFSQARDTQRRSDLLSITNAIYQFAAEHDGNLPDTDNDDTKSNFPTTPTCIGNSSGCFDLASAGQEDGSDLDFDPDDMIVPTYIAAMPRDPSTGTSSDTGYTIYVNSNGRVVAKAVGELVPEITVER